ncbi:MAG TPA: enoyl-ACP reductase [Verrucomicrobiae bacterium]|jgi:enoyl-[acyl-carrier protein] reductase I|nr:enoyl-ACP reductase [Verrucomicrobiae bacterium]
MPEQTMTENEPFTSNLLKGKKGLVLGVANKRSIAWGIAKALSANGAQLAFTYQGERLQESVKELADTLPGTSPLYGCDVSKDEEIKSVFDKLASDFGSLDFMIHCIAFAKKEELAGRTVETSREGFHLAQDISAFSLLALSKAAEPLLEKNGGSIVALTYLGSEKVVPNYNVMGLAKASLESAIRYLAADLGPKKIRVNGISAGPVNTLAARGIAGFTTMLESHRNRAALKRNVELEEVGNAGLFLASPLSGGITGEILYVDCGYRIMGA